MESAEHAAPLSRVAVLGPGGVGGLLAAVLARAGHEVVCIAGDATAELLRTKGISVRSEEFGEFTAPVAADTRLREPVDLCLVAVKQTALEDALTRVDPETLGDGLLVPLLNGVEHPALLRERYRPELVAPGVIRVESTRLEPGLIVHSSPFADLDLASATAPRARLDAAAAVLAAAGFGARVLADETTALWSKMGFIAPMALLTTRYDQSVGEVRTEHRAELFAAIGEVAAVAEACGAELDLADVEAFYLTVPAGMKSSMQRDAEAGRPLELDAIGGAVLRAAALRGVSVPVVTDLVLRLAARS
ncbi:MAG TPA: 2-dehydropantoate 2-reductase [Actinospica sp.]|jgi:2-dehydropantoate 2-reductase|nr:2-dehydropantoate 2-reductase [Actinospica sp.]